MAVNRLRREFGAKFRSDKPPRNTIFEVFPEIKQSQSKLERESKALQEVEDRLFEMKIGKPQQKSFL